MNVRLSIILAVSVLWTAAAWAGYGAPGSAAAPIKADEKPQIQLIAVQLYADGCPLCKTMKPAYEQIQQIFAGQMEFVRFDRSTDETSQASVIMAAGKGLEHIYNSYDGTGIVLLVDAVTKEVVGQLIPGETLQEMAASINQILAGEKVPAAKNPSASKMCCG